MEKFWVNKSEDVSEFKILACLLSYHSYAQYTNLRKHKQNVSI